MKNYEMFDTILGSDEEEICEPSELYSLEPIVGSSYLVEGLASYIARVAEAHTLNTGTLISKKIAPLFLNNNFTVEFEKAKFESMSTRINSNGKLTIELVNALEKLTKQNDLSLLAFINWSAFPAQYFVRKSKAWCPACFNEWKGCGKPIYEPLIWSLRDVTYCPKHLCKLVEMCKSCNKRIPHIFFKSRVGHCSRCLSWLGEATIYHYVPDEWETWRVQNICMLLQYTHHNNAIITTELLTNTIKRIKMDFFEGSLRKFSRQMNFARNRVMAWINKGEPISFNSALKISYYLNINLLHLILGHYQSKGITIRIEAKDIKFKRENSTFSGEEIQEKLKEILAHDQYPPLSMIQVGKRLGISRQTIYKHARELSQIIARRYENYCNKRKEERVSKLHKEIRLVILERYRLDGKIPSTRETRSLIKTTHNSDEFRVYYAEVTSEIKKT